MTDTERREDLLEAMLKLALRMRDEYMVRWQSTQGAEWHHAVKQIAEVQFILMDLKSNER